ncbi:cysteine--tRNA ligase [Ruegeria pomeroyi]|jgi:cysteinyl-tRNA synthetase|uniref:Cysteine--tRNA ligase n=2 Tax=Ruegeria pomeroyi TaxID=89184 RepID=SYC_RUEPO|nr:cysteine--tRNA ligase [Ruegeria pomeroyi]Q5LRJ6.1 RecName: Full=Cysteine--tRNA ligase; AltName: Full=Cysteinyl-tRNA synthetase; Short=CysRS [Ruegeria pomeroyi DSS-3]HCE70799.1 cysteine--tRNA ligase [Ruegeria sp.]AAV95400.1 cysteinyl-tRNA synthetase [Ruegeria pomeroyi DSS-3]NVK96896.1 cysteine--tRNA ligase [Ruegeria pomeroyi]NVL02790.1 cysteine--tRNA ligase [Ruegeria pomeroyi]QWV08966.1 cysteine--tRNA ligase [Ruegeria pomeroyi]
MTTIKLHNTRTRTKEEFVPIDPDNVRMYVCGPTVYDRAHLGNGRPVVVFDVLYRLLRHVYGADHVTYVRNFTDVDDKINARAAERGRPIGDITAETTQWFLDDMGALGALEPDHMPRATQYIPQMVAMIEELVAKGHAYEAEGHVLFAVDSWKEHYGKLSGRSVDDMIAGARVEVAPYKKNPMDFVLWKPSTPDLPGWDSPWGRGRPGWHIECSAMSYELLGESFDIHGGGNDLMFPHHENEIAQSCCAHPEGHFANFWLHNEMLQVEGKKMSKSLGNFFTVRDLLDQGIPGEVIRFVFLSTHYRKPMDWTEKKAKEAEATLRKWWRLTAPLDEMEIKPSPQFIDALTDDLNTPGAIAELHRLAKEKDYAALEAGLEMLGLQETVNFGVASFGFSTSVEVLEAANDLARRWMAYRDAKNFEEADRLKKSALLAGVDLSVSKEGGIQVPSATINGSPTVDELEALK